MKRTNLINCAAILLLSLFLTTASAQTVTIKGVVTEEFSVKEGKITVYLPDDIRTGETISGTVIAEPAGKNDKEKNRNNATLQKYKVNVGSATISLKGGQRQFFKLTSAPQNLFIILFDEKNNALSNRSVPANNIVPVIKDFSLPTHALTSSPLIIHGPFDGDAADTHCRLDGKEMEILAESPRQIVCTMPETNSGPHNIIVEENGKTIEQKISAVNLDLVVAKTNLLRGEKTEFAVKVSGLEGIRENVPLTLVNTSPSIITITGGNTQVINITPSQVGNTGTFSQSFNVQSITSGNFSVSADLHLPEPSSMNNNSGALCNCYINEHSYLIPPQTCLTLGGTLDLPLINNSQQQQSEPSSTKPPIVSFQPPGPINEQTGVIPLRVTAPSNDVAAVIFSERPVSGTEWNPVGYAVNTGKSWQYNWTAPIGNDGEHIIRARVAGKNNVVTEMFTQTYIQRTTYTLNPIPGENINLTVTENDIRTADEKTKKIIDSLRRLQDKLDALQKKYNEFVQKQKEDSTMAGELADIDRVIDQVPGLYRDSLKTLIDSLNNLKTILPAKIDPAALQKAADDAAQRLKDCEDRLNKLKQDRDQAQKDLDALNKQIEDLLNKMDQLHLGNNWIGGHGYHSDGGFWYGYVGDERSNTNITAESNAISNQLHALKGPQNKANNRAKALNAAIAAAEAECDKLKKEKEKAEEAAKNGNQYAAAETQVDELCRQIEALMAALQEWCDAHPGVCSFGPGLPANPRSPAELQAYLDKLNDIIVKKKQKEADLKNEADKNASDAESTGDDIKEGNGDKKDLEGDKAKAQAGADKLRKEREQQLEAERAARQKKIDEENVKRNKPNPKPLLTDPVNPSNEQLKFNSIGWVLRPLIYEYKYSKGMPCDCITKALILANNSNTAAQDLVGRIGVGVAFAPLEAFPGFSFGVRLGIGVAKSIGNALFGGQEISDELAKNLFNVIGGEIFPKLLGDEFAGNRLNDLASGGLDAVLNDEGVRAFGWDGEAEIECGNKTVKVKGKTTMLFNPNTGWVTMMIKIDNCPLIVVKYQVNKDGIPVTKPSVTKVNG